MIRCTGYSRLSLWVRYWVLLILVCVPASSSATKPGDPRKIDWLRPHIQFDGALLPSNFKVLSTPRDILVTNAGNQPIFLLVMADLYESWTPPPAEELPVDPPVGMVGAIRLQAGSVWYWRAEEPSMAVDHGDVVDPKASQRQEATVTAAAPVAAGQWQRLESSEYLTIRDTSTGSGIHLFIFAPGLEDRNQRGYGRPNNVRVPDPQRGHVWLMTESALVQVPVTLSYELNPEYKGDWISRLTPGVLSLLTQVCFVVLGIVALLPLLMFISRLFSRRVLAQKGAATRESDEE